MEHRRLGNSGLKVPVLSFGTATFGGGDDFFKAWGDTDELGATALVDECIAAGITMFDTADAYSDGLAEHILGTAIAGRRDSILLSTKVTDPTGPGPNERGSSRQHLATAVEKSLRRLQTDYIDVLYMHEFDGTTPVEEVVRALDDLISAGKVRYVGASNFSGWQLMKSLAVADSEHRARYVAHQVNYSLLQRDYEHELLPLAEDQGVAAVVWSGLAGGALTGKVRRGQEVPSGTRVGSAFGTLTHDNERLFQIVDVLDEVAKEIGKSVGQIALNWLLRKSTVASVVVGARSVAQLRENVGAVGWSLSTEHLEKLDAVSRSYVPFPYSHQHLFPFFQPTHWLESRSRLD